MRTKTLLLSAAALAAGVLASQAQSNVYSANVVGYASVVLAGNGQYTLVANPFDDGNGNELTNIMNAALPAQSQVLTWDVAGGYTTYKKGGSPATWNSTTNLPPGVGFFVRNGGPGGGAPAVTNTFVGSIVVANGSSVTNNMAVGYTLQGSPIPYAGNIATAGQAGGDTNMDFGTPLQLQAQILTYDSVAGYTTSKKGGSPAAWNLTVPVTPGQGFFIYNKNGPATNTVETLNLQ